MATKSRESFKSRFNLPDVPAPILRKHIRELSPAQRDSILYTALLGCTHSEAATILVMTQPAVTKNIHRGMKNLRNALKIYGY
jgi:DNA-directed RNA polymerase specialized sigma24 family protein